MITIMFDVHNLTYDKYSNNWLSMKLTISEDRFIRFVPILETMIDEWK